MRTREPNVQDPKERKSDLQRPGHGAEQRASTPVRDQDPGPEPRFGVDFSEVPIHSPEAVETTEVEPARIQLAPTGSIATGADEDLHIAAERLRSEGQIVATASAGVTTGGGPIPHQGKMEQAFGISFADVRAHTDESAAHASRALAAHAYTVGDSIAFAAPNPPAALVAHELTHVVQQRAGAAPPGLSHRGDPFEHEAALVAAAVERGGQTDVAHRYGLMSTIGLQRGTVQRSESGEHASMGAGPDYPFRLGEIHNINGATVSRGELVAFGDFYAGIEQIRQAPFAELQALSGYVRLEALWLLMDRHSASQTAFEGSPSGFEEKSVAPARGSAGGGSKSVPKNSKVTWLDPIWDQIYKGLGTPREKAKEICAAFRPSWEFFGIQITPELRPDGNLAALKATLGRRKGRAENDPVEGEKAGKPADKFGKGADYLDLAQSNIGHFAVHNWDTYATMHQSVCAKVKGAKESERAKIIEDALIEDGLANHFLTDMFASGHQIVDKQAIMHYATDLFEKKATEKGFMHQRFRTVGRPERAKQVPYSPEENKHEAFRDLLRKTLKYVFDEDDVLKAWNVGCYRALQQKLISLDKFKMMVIIGRGNYWAEGHATVVGNLVDAVIMPMPWRKDQPKGKSTERTRSWGAPTEQAGAKGAYHLGIGNLAAKKIHDIFNEIGFEASNKAGDTWYMRGDLQMDERTRGLAQMAVELSSQQVKTGNCNLDEIKNLTPSMARFDGEAITQFYDARSKEHFNKDALDRLREAVKQAEEMPVPLLNAEGSAMSATVKEICERMLDVEFTPQETTKEGDRDQGAEETGINISMLREFLKKNLPDMVPLAYAAADFGDLPEQAQEIY